MCGIVGAKLKKTAHNDRDGHATEGPPLYRNFRQTNRKRIQTPWTVMKVYGKRFKRPLLVDEDHRSGLATCAMLSLVLSFVLWTLWTFSSVRTSQQMFSAQWPQMASGENEHRWSQFSPYFDAGNYTAVPEGCTVTQVNIVQRHGARYPTSSAGRAYRAAVEKLQAANLSSDSRLAFLHNYSYSLGAQDLVPLGALQSRQAGQRIFGRYAALVNESNEAYVPFVRASGAQRCVDSAANWTAGFASASGGTIFPIVNVVIPETGNDTLDNSMCPAQPDLTDKHVDPWENIYASPIAKRLNALASGANLNASDVTSLISLCAFESVNGNYMEGEAVRENALCELFEHEEFESFEYVQDLAKYYGTGYGNRLGPVQGVGYVNELLARLTNTPVNDSTQTNHTLDSSPTTFPLNRTIYADFSHDNLMTAIYSAIGLFNDSQRLPASEDASDRKWRNSRMVPFSGRLVTERMQCVEEVYVRMFVDDALMKLGFCGADEAGMCTLDAFVESQAYSREQGRGDFEKCDTDS